MEGFPGEETAVYPGSIVARCNRCNGEIYVGPRQQEVDGERVCFLCAAQEMLVRAEQNKQTDLINLDNPYQRKESP